MWQSLVNSKCIKPWWTEKFLEQIVQISVIFISNKSISMKIKEWSNCKCRGSFENVRTSRFQICPWFWRLTKICNRAKQNMQLFLPVLYGSDGAYFLHLFSWNKMDWRLQLHVIIGYWQKKVGGFSLWPNFNINPKSSYTCNFVFILFG